MCIERPGRIVEMGAGRPDVARVDVAGVIKTVHLGMLAGEPPVVGDWLALHLGFAIERISEAEAREAIAYAENDPFATLLGGDSAPMPTPAPAMEASR